MKKSLLLGIVAATGLLASTVSSQAAAGYVAIDNYFGADFDFHGIFQGASQAPSGTYVQIVAGGNPLWTDSSATTPYGPIAVNYFDFSPDGGAVFYYSGQTGYASGTAMTMQAWYGAASYAAALTTPGAWAGSVSWAGAVGPSTGLAASFSNPQLVMSVTPVPEPSTFALAGLGLAGLLIFRRRK